MNSVVCILTCNELVLKKICFTELMPCEILYTIIVVERVMCMYVVPCPCRFATICPSMSTDATE